MNLTFQYIKSDEPQLTDDMIICDQFPEFHIQVAQDGNFYLIKELSGSQFQDMGRYYSKQMAQKRLEFFATTA